MYPAVRRAEWFEWRWVTNTRLFCSTTATLMSGVPETTTPSSWSLRPTRSLKSPQTEITASPYWPTAVSRDAALARMTTLGDFEGAYKSLTRALARYGGDHRTHAVAGMAAQELGRAAEAAEHYRGCLVINDAEPQCRSGLRQAKAAAPKGKRRKAGRKKGKQEL